MIISKELNPIQKAVVKMEFDYVAKRSSYMASDVNDDGISEIKAISEEQREVELIGNAYKYFDSDADVLWKGSASKSISERGVNSTGNRKIKFALQHDISQLTGTYNTLSDTEQGIYAKVNIFPDSDELGKQTWLRYKTKAYTEHSIGFSYMQIEWLEANSEGFKRLIESVINKEEAINYGGFYSVKEINLYEISTVTFGANEQSGVLGLKSADYNPKTIAQKRKAFWSLVKSDVPKNGTIDKYVQEIQQKQYDAMVLEEHYLKQYNKGLNKEPFKDTLKAESRLNDTLRAEKRKSIILSLRNN